MKNFYETRENLDAKRLKGLLIMYDSALTACAEENAEHLNVALDVLQSKLNFDVWPVLGMLLFAQYNRCRELGKAGDFFGAGRVLATLRASWTEPERRAKKEVAKMVEKEARIARAARIKERFEKEGHVELSQPELQPL